MVHDIYFLVGLLAGFVTSAGCIASLASNDASFCTGWAAGISHFTELDGII